MALSVKQLLRRRGALVAAIAAVSLLAALNLKDFLQALLGGLPQPDFSGLSDRILTANLPFVVGVFLCLWLILPITGDLLLRFVITRALGAVLFGAVLVFVVYIVVGFVEGVQNGGLPTPEQFGVFALRQLVGVALYVNIAWAFATLAALIQWNWLKHHPAKFEVAGILDV